MQFPERFESQPEYAFPRLRRLLAGVTPGGPELAMSIGEPRHPLPAFVPEIIAAHAAAFGRYPPNEGTLELREAITGWIARRYGVALDSTRQVLPLNGTREGLFNAGLALCPEAKNGRPVVLMPNPYYQAYGAAARAVGAEPVILPATAETGFLPDFASLPKDVLDRTALAFVGSPSNPQGAVASLAWWRKLVALAERHDFLILADECYSEIYYGAPPPGALEAARDAGADPERVLAFHSLSKRSSAPGLRSGFVAGGPRAIARMLRLRGYGGAPIPLPIQAASAALWRDEAHVAANRALYAEKRRLADAILGDLPGYRAPEAGFFLWIHVGDGEAATLRLWREAGVRVVPGGYLGQDTPQGSPGQGNPGDPFIRVALVASVEDVTRGLHAIRAVLGVPPTFQRV